MGEGNGSRLLVSEEPSIMGFSVLADPDKPLLDIVFIHGFTGHPEWTWTYKGEELIHGDKLDNEEALEFPSKFRKLLPSSSNHHRKSVIRKSVYWPRDLVPLTVPDARVLTYGYDTHIRHWLGSAINKSTVYDIAWDFLVSLEAIRRSEPARPLLFVAHSLGGIVVKEALRRSRGCENYQGYLHRVFESTVGVMFFGTPHGGADPRGWVQHVAERAIRASGFSVNEQIVSTLLPSSDRLRELRDEFGPMARQKNWIIYSFQEQYGVKVLSGNKVVDNSSSCLNDPSIETTQHIASNHMDMCRFSGPKDVQYIAVSAALERVVQAIFERTVPSKSSVLNTEQRKMLLDSLKFDQIHARYKTIKNAHAKTCKWLLSESKYQDWLNDDKLSEHHGFIWIKGKPGTGKSTMMKFALAHASRNMKEIAISFFFNARGEDLEKSTVGMYRSLLSQLLERIPELGTVLYNLVLSILDNTGSHNWNIESIKELFGFAIRQLGERSLVCFIDALDECDEDSIRDMVIFFDYLGELAISEEIRFRVCFSSRHYPSITIGKGLDLILEGQEGHTQDIANYLNTELKIGRSKQAEQIRGQILEKASGIFIWVTLVVQILNKEFDRGRIYALQRRLREIPSDLHALFRNILTRDGEHQEELLLCIQWILFTKRPLKREELFFAVLSGIEPTALALWNPEEITTNDMERFIINSSKGLAEVTKSQNPTIQFIHESVKDFLLKERGIGQLWPDHASDFTTRSQDRLKQCCYNYMRFDLSDYISFSVILPTAPSQDAANLRKLAAEKFPFLEYAVHNVFYHADAAQSGDIQQGIFIDTFPLRDWIILDNLFEKHEVRRRTPFAHLLYIFAEQNLANLIKIHPSRASHVDIEGERYGFPLIAALVHDSQEAVKALLLTMDQQSNNVSHPSCSTHRQPPLRFNNTRFKRTINHRQGRTLLSYVVRYGDELLLSFLLQTWRHIVDSKDCDGRTSLSWMAKNGNEVIVRVLIEQGADLKLRDNYGCTPLSLASRNGHGDIVKFLIEKGADLQSSDNEGCTPLSWASRNGHGDIVKILIEKGADLQSRDNYGHTPLSLASRNEQGDKVKFLIEKGADLQSRDNYGHTPLSLASRNGQGDIVKFLIEKGAEL